MNYIVLDLEWNQSPGGKEDSVAHLPFEIIEIGAVMLDNQFRPAGEFHKLIKPQVYKKMHFKISEVTHMDMKKLCQEGQPFGAVMEEFLDWCGDGDFRFCTWGSMDLTELQRNMIYHGMEIPFPRPLLYYDIQKLYCLQYGDGKNKVSLDQAVQLQGMAEDRPFHRALDDAFYTGKIRAGYGEVRRICVRGLLWAAGDKRKRVQVIFPGIHKIRIQGIQLQGRHHERQGYHRHGVPEMQAYAPQENPLVPLRPKILLLPGRLPRTRICQRKNPR